MSKKIGEDLDNGKLLNDIGVSNKVLSVDKNKNKNENPSVCSPSTRSKSPGKPDLPEPRSKIKHGNKDLSHKEKKSFWKWRSLTAFSNVRNRRFTCCFHLQVGSIVGLSPSFNDMSLCVHWKLRDGSLVTHPAKVLDATAEFGGKTRDGGLMTRPAKVLDGTAEIEEKLTYTCSVYGSTSGSYRSAKYEAKHFVLYASVSEAPELDLGKHRVDFTRLLPLTWEELEKEKSSGKWKTSFKLSGKAKGATMNVSFVYTVTGDSPVSSDNPEPRRPVAGYGHVDWKDNIGLVESHPHLVKCQSLPLSRSVDDLKDLHEVLPVSRSELGSPVTMRYQNFDDKSDCSVSYKPESDVFTECFGPTKPQSYTMPESSKKNIEIKIQDNECFVVENKIQLSSKEEAKLEEDTTMAAAVHILERPQVVEIDPAVGANSEKGTQLQLTNEVGGSPQDLLMVQAHNTQEDDQCSKVSLLKELEVALSSVSKLETPLDSPEDQSDLEIQTKYKYSGDLDEITETVASEFLNMLGVAHSPFGLSSESEPESPRERLLRQFEKDTLASGHPLFGFDVDDREQPEHSHENRTASPWGKGSGGLAMSSVIPVAKEEVWMATCERGKTRAKILDDLETEALMHQWGLNEKAFEFSPPGSSGGFGSEVHLPSEEPLDLPPLGEGLGPFLQTKNGGYLRSMNPSLFKNAKNGGSLIMQVSCPVVVLAEMGSGIMEILERLASLGIEKLSMQANKVMPLEDITGKTMQQVAREAAPTLEGPERQCLLQHESEAGQDISGGKRKVRGRSSGSQSNKYNSASADQMGSEYASLEDLAPLAVDKIEALSMEGLRIQSGMSDEEAPSNISTQSIGEISALQGKGVGLSDSLGLEGAAGLQLLDIKDTGNSVDELMGLSLTLDEWMRLDSGEIDDEDQISEQTSKILAAHHANSLDFVRGRSKGGRRGKKCGLLGNNFTVALMVQLRDPLRNYEPVGAPMLAFIQVERVFIPPKPKVYRKVTGFGNNSEEGDESESRNKEEAKEMEDEGVAKEERIPQFRITDVHLAGWKPEPGNKKLQGSTNQKQSGSRWLLANGMGKGNKVMKSKAVPKPSTSTTGKVQPVDTLWSISSRMLGAGDKWKGVLALNPHVRNPNIIFPNETISLLS